MIRITIDNGSNNTAGGSCYSAHQAVRFAEDHIDTVSCVHRKCQTRAGVSWHINTSNECVNIADRKFSDRSSSGMNDVKYINSTVLRLGNAQSMLCLPS